MLASLPMLAVTKDGVGVAMFVIGMICVVLVGISVLVRNRVDSLEPETQAITLWILSAVALVVLVAAVGAWIRSNP